MATIPPKPDPYGSPTRIPTGLLGAGLLPPVGVSLPAASSGLPGPVGISFPAPAGGLASARDKATVDPSLKPRASLLTENVSATLLELGERHPLETLPPWLRQCHDDALA